MSPSYSSGAISVVPSGVIYCPWTEDERDMHECVECRFYRGMEIMRGYGAPSCHAVACAFPDSKSSP
jgi:Zn ribbon nucleic-acid-binding protein